MSHGRRHVVSAALSLGLRDQLEMSRSILLSRSSGGWGAETYRKEITECNRKSYRQCGILGWIPGWKKKGHQWENW